MPADPRPGRLSRLRPPASVAGTRRSPALFALLSGLLLGCAGAAGCGSVVSAGESSSSQEFVSDIAARLSSATSTTYTAVYALHSGGTGTLVEDATAGDTAFKYPTGMTVVTPKGATVCRTNSAQASTCNRSTTITAAADRIARGGLIRPQSVVSMLTASGIDRDSIITEHDTTIAGSTATCVTVAHGTVDSNEYDACVTVDGLLGSFRGEFAGALVDITMVSVSDSVSDGSFTLPASR